MKAIAVSIVALLLLLGTVAPLFADDVSVKGYFRNDGTYVQPHMRSMLDSSYNKSIYPDTNPYTGQQGTHQPRLFDNNSNSSGYGYGLGGGSKQRSRW